MKTRFDLTLLAAATLSLLAGAASAQDKTLTINSFGGAYETAHRKCIITPFEKETGATTKVVTAYSADAFTQVRAQKAAPQYDVIHFSGGQEIVAATEGLLSPIDASKVPSLAKVRFNEIMAHLPQGTPPITREQRFNQIAARRKHLQQRCHR